jgi:hypothetical protein
MVIKGKTEELLIKQLKSCEKKMQKLTDSIKRPNLRIMGIEEGEEVPAPMVVSPASGEEPGCAATGAFESFRSW